MYLTAGCRAPNIDGCIETTRLRHFRLPPETQLTESYLINAFVLVIVNIK